MSSPAVQPLLALLAAHVGGNPTQYMFEQAFRHHDLDWRYLTFEVTPDNLREAVAGLRALGFRGGHCADPHQELIAPHLDRITPMAEQIGMVDLMFRDGDHLVGDNAMGEGLVRLLREQTDLAAKHAVLLELGPSVRSTAFKLAAAGVGRISFAVEKADPSPTDLADAIREKYDIETTIATPNGDTDQLLEIDILICNAKNYCEPADDVMSRLANALISELLVVDLCIDTTQSPLLERAKQKGCPIIDGLSIFVEQAACDFELWTGVNPNRQVLRESVEEFLEI